MTRKQKSNWDRKVEAAVVHAIAEHQQAMFSDPNRPDLRPLNVRALFQRFGEMHGVPAEDIANWCAEKFIVNSAIQWNRKGLR
jgi:hypothetical protein